jgi:hypothetical protein
MTTRVKPPAAVPLRFQIGYPGKAFGPQAVDSRAQPGSLPAGEPACRTRN